MIPTKTEIEVEGSLPGEAVQMTLDANSLAHLMTVLTNLYSDKTLAIVREYSTNARDSHIEAGCPNRPIEVSTPSDFMPYFRVRDYGVGMDAETIRNVYSRYGASTKRGTNSQNGMLGLGSKSALTYTSQFTIQGIKDGIKTHVVVSRAQDGSGVMQIVGQKQTTEENGVTIEIPVTNRRELENTAYSFFKYWEPGTVLLNGKDPSVKETIRFGKFSVNESGYSDYIVMGNVAYPIPQDHRIFKNNGSRTCVVAYVDMGEVNFTPSREALHMTALTKTTLDKLRNEFAALARAYVTDKVEKAESHAEALENYYELQRTNLGIYADKIEYKGEVIPHSVSFKWCYRPAFGSASEASFTDIRRLVQNKSLIVHGYEYDKIHTNHRQKLKLWSDANGQDVGFAYFTKDVPLPNWLATVPQVHWNDVKAMKVIRPKAASVKSELYDAINNRGYRVANQKIDLTKTVVYASPVSFVSDDARDMAARFIVDDKTQLVLVNKNKWKAFLAEIPQAVHADVYVKDMISKYVANMTPEQEVYLRSNWKDRHFCARLDESKVDDPAIKTAIKALCVDGLSDATAKRYEAMRDLALKWSIQFPNFAAQSERLFEQYPMLDVYGHRNANYYPIEHVYLYINGCYKQKLKVDPSKYRY
jgi:hypothetical protein